MSAYQKTLGGKLKFKGDSSEGKKKDKKKRARAEGGDHSTSSSSRAEHVVGDEEEEEDVSIVAGTGRITSSGTTIYGHQTKFSDEIRVGDAIIITHPTSLMEETKIVKMVLSNVSISISSGFSTDLVSTTQFRYVKAPRRKDGSQADESKKAKVIPKDSEEAAFGTYAGDGGATFTYRVKTQGAFGGYKIVSEVLFIW